MRQNLTGSEISLQTYKDIDPEGRFCYLELNSLIAGASELLEAGYGSGDRRQAKMTSG